ncbi:hypothetical protein PICMEDRAFT_129048 [Pichia membranifaciens NRRL Y-2026]|uniref:Uncharacterized protein n=1 Tax=Pichia membranifaciens NRRL Y-2026 TaxID=763406 RepID=A0A1E3NLC8_9ASCO|nr:hypothetical protein PICMEDRAFT_129048 [Pichia membranifaciens NRRL Y-2026]ODQ46378.1 hypothetical protein PICMEDRAFT_129048 [Pichia membranifaciens NRRL Y-2026]
MRPASGPRTARAFIPATATYRLGRQQRSAPHDRHQGPSQHDGTTAVGVVGGGPLPGRVAASGSAAAEECARQVGGENTPLLGSRKAQTTVATRKGVSWILATQFFT